MCAGRSVPYAPRVFSHIRLCIPFESSCYVDPPRVTAFSVVYSLPVTAAARRSIDLVRFRTQARVCGSPLRFPALPLRGTRQPLRLILPRQYRRTRPHRNHRPMPFYIHRFDGTIPPTAARVPICNRFALPGCLGFSKSAARPRNGGAFSA